jgi:hypothetical protein
LPAESGKELAADIPHVLDLTTEALPVQEEVAHAFAAPDLKLRGAAAMRRVLDSIAAELTPAAAPWATDREAFATATADAAAREFSEAFNRWRQLYEGAPAQLKEANRKSEMHGLSAKERKAAKDLQAQANEQLALPPAGVSCFRYRIAVAPPSPTVRPVRSITPNSPCRPPPWRQSRRHDRRSAADYAGQRIPYPSRRSVKSP